MKASRFLIHPMQTARFPYIALAHRYGLDLTENLVSCCVDPAWQPPPSLALPPGLAAAPAANQDLGPSGRSPVTHATTTRARFDRSAANDLPSACAQLAYGISLEPHHGATLRRFSKSVLQWTAGFPLPSAAEAVEMRRWAAAARPSVHAIQRLYSQWPELQTPGW